MFKKQVTVDNVAASHKGCWNYWSLCLWGAASPLHAHTTATDATTTSTDIPGTIANVTFVLLPMAVEFPLHQAASSCVLPFLVGTSSACGGSTTHMSPFQRTEARVATAELSRFPIPGSNQARAVTAVETTREDSWKRDVRQGELYQGRWYPTSATWGKKRSCTYGLHMGTGFGSQQKWTIGKQRGSKMHFLVSWSSADALSKTGYKIGRYLRLWFASNEKHKSKVTYHLFTGLWGGTAYLKVPCPSSLPFTCSSFKSGPQRNHIVPTLLSLAKKNIKKRSSFHLL